ncbi:MAG: CHRD domain-containing protein [Alphaproteobacteria bacterium]
MANRLKTGIALAALAAAAFALPTTASATVFSFSGTLSPCAEVLQSPIGNVGIDGIQGNADDDPCGARSGAPGSVHSGTFSATYDDVTKIFDYMFSYTGLTNPPAASPLFDGDPFSDWHLHVGGPNENGLIFLPGNTQNPPAANSNPYVNSFDATTIGLPLATFESGLQNGDFYINIHSDAYRNGELRSQIVRDDIPEPAALGLLGLGMIGLVAMRRRRR